MSWNLSVSDIAGIVTLLTGLLIGLATAYVTYKRGVDTGVGKGIKSLTGIPIVLAPDDRAAVDSLATSFHQIVQGEIRLALSEADRIAHAALLREIQHLSNEIAMHGRNN